MHVCVPYMYVHATLGDEKKVLDPLEPSLWMVMSGHVDFGNQTWVLHRSSSALNTGATSLSPQGSIFEGPFCFKFYVKHNPI